jgi:hypothetical protein
VLRQSPNPNASRGWPSRCWTHPTRRSAGRQRRRASLRESSRLDKNKTDDPRAWALDAGTADALGLYREHFRAKAEPHELVFLDPTGQPHTKFGAAALLRAHL